MRGEVAATAATEVVDLLGSTLEGWFATVFPEVTGDRAAMARVVCGQVFALVVEHLALGEVSRATARARAEELAGVLLPSG